MQHTNPYPMWKASSAAQEASAMVKISAIESTESSRAHIRRVFPTTIAASRDPFVLLDEFFVDESAGFPLHLHRGFEAVTYIIDGTLRHTDNLGNHDTIGSGGVHFFCAGSGICHAEMPVGKGVCHGLQLWINLPPELKKVHPSYQRVESNGIPEERPPGGVLRHILGGPSPIEVKTDVHFEDVHINADSSCEILMPESHDGFVYVYEGTAYILDITLEPGTGLVLERGERHTIWCNTRTRMVVISGMPLGRPITMHDGVVD
ncbi:MAG: hypothetical protein GF344_14120 [Chitinivibrionales bacterium]|nr:hypothetical protein [Chitinivibrionales bacterium]MBD3357862.1 hypothetical protein [Chitinivibrionales bacterium]